MNTIGQNIADFRKRRGMTQEELAEKMCVTAQAVSKWERDTSYPDVSTLSTLANVLNVSVAAIIDGAKAVPELHEAPQDEIDRRVLLIEVKTGETYVTVRFPVTAMKKAIENGTLEKIVGKDVFAQVVMTLEMADLGLTGPLVTVDNEATHIQITVENDES